ncbi:MAG: hypothetical protein GXN92_02185 [Candidatus Micrarchaeota archaeon]|nr:hypothetical protein [Candidatus Micrarchaeota archaeon]
MVGQKQEFPMPREKERPGSRIFRKIEEWGKKVTPFLVAANFMLGFPVVPKVANSPPINAAYAQYDPHVTYMFDYRVKIYTFDVGKMGYEYKTFLEVLADKAQMEVPLNRFVKIEDPKLPDGYYIRTPQNLHAIIYKQGIIFYNTTDKGVLKGMIWFIMPSSLLHYQFKEVECKEKMCIVYVTEPTEKEPGKLLAVKLAKNTLSEFPYRFVIYKGEYTDKNHIRFTGKDIYHKIIASGPPSYPSIAEVVP